MDGRIETLNRHLKRHDRDLYAQRTGSGMIVIYRTEKYVERFEFQDKSFGVVRTCPGLVLALTDNWLVTGKPIEWGIVPIIFRLNEIDGWRDDSRGEKLRKDRERSDELRERAQTNEFRALAMDSRRAFAKATNDINTSTMEKVDKRRLKDGISKQR